jgi:hypothetical protein
VIEHRAADAAAPRSLGGVHGLQLSVVRVKLLERAYPEQLSAPTEAEERDGRVEESVDVQGMNVLRRGVRVGEREVPLQKLANVGGSRVINRDLGPVHAKKATSSEAGDPPRALALVASAVAARSGLQVAAGWAQSRLQPQIDRVVELRLFDLTTRVDLPAFDDARFHDAMLRARDRGLYSASQVVGTEIDCLTGAVGIVSAGVVVGLLNPILLVLIVYEGVPAPAQRGG